MSFGLGLGGSGRVRGRGSDGDGLYGLRAAEGALYDENDLRCCMK